jgi:ribokinase
MSNILISGLVNVETTLKVRQFPIEYYPIDYPFFGIRTAVSCVAYNVAKAAATLGDRVRLLSMTGSDFQAAYIRDALTGCGIGAACVLPVLDETPSSVILYEESGRRQVWCDLKDIQESAYPFSEECLDGVDLVVACNINFNRPLLARAKAAGKTIATDVHVLSDIYDDYNRDFLSYADILFLSDEALGEHYHGFIRELAGVYGNKVIVLGRGSKGAAIFLKDSGQLLELPAVRVGQIVNTVGAGDALFTAFIHYYSNGLDPVEALICGELFASAKIGVSGGAEGFVDEMQIQMYYDRFADQIKQQIRTINL